MNGPAPLIQPSQCVLLLIDHQANLSVGVGSGDRESIVGKVVALARTASVFSIPTVVTVIQSAAQRGPILASVLTSITGASPIARHNLNCWEDEQVRGAVVKAQRHRLLVSGLLTEACVAFPVLSALAEGYQVFVVSDACGGISVESHALALRRMEVAGAHMVSWIQVLLELQRDWTREDTAREAFAIVDSYSASYAMALGLTQGVRPPE
jgi:nicotinamidase-related amidase